MRYCVCHSGLSKLSEAPLRVRSGSNPPWIQPIKSISPPIINSPSMEIMEPKGHEGRRMVPTQWLFTGVVKTVGGIDGDTEGRRARRSAMIFPDGGWRLKKAMWILDLGSGHRGLLVLLVAAVALPGKPRPCQSSVEAVVARSRVEIFAKKKREENERRVSSSGFRDGDLE